MRKNERQPKLSISVRPKEVRNTIAAAKDDDQMPSACARSFPSLKVTAKIAIAVDNPLNQRSLNDPKNNH